MAIPKLELPSYECKLPSGKIIKYRPFTVKERSILLVALQSEDNKTIIGAIDRLFEVCTFGECRIEQMPIVDAEYLFIQIRNKSTGEDLDVVHTCDCGTQNDVRLDMGKVEVVGENASTDINMGGENWVKMNYPNFKNTEILSDDPTEDEVITVIASCIDSVIRGQEVFKARDNSLDDMKEFVLSLTQPQLDLVEAFFEALPKVIIKGEYNCKCGKHNQFTIEGLENFFD